jgi:hypothetical protein
MSVKEDFLGEVSNCVTRDGVNDLVSYLLTETDFFKAPASSKYHGAVEEGLIMHSLTVLDVMNELKEYLNMDVSKESMVICGLFHDVCKINFYILDDEMASPAQLRYLQDLCEENKVHMPPKSERTKAYASLAINDLKSGRGLPKFRPSYRVKDTMPMGHGEKSVYIINKFMALSDEEALAIRWHLGGFDPGIQFAYPSGIPYKQAVLGHKLVTLLSASDSIASYLVDEW